MEQVREATASLFSTKPLVDPKKAFVSAPNLRAVDKAVTISQEQPEEIAENVKEGEGGEGDWEDVEDEAEKSMVLLPR